MSQTGPDQQNDLPTVDEPRSLPFRALAAYAARRARHARVQYTARDAKGREHKEAIAKAIKAVEDFARSDRIPLTPEEYAKIRDGAQSAADAAVGETCEFRELARHAASAAVRAVNVVGLSIQWHESYRMGVGPPDEHPTQMAAKAAQEELKSCPVRAAARLSQARQDYEILVDGGFGNAGELGRPIAPWPFPRIDPEDPTEPV